ncbi:MAG: class I tRNA ligase family protein, partial [Terriglobales bacterium]
MAEPFYLTTPLYYVNAAPHLGHAYSTIVADAMVRFQRQLGREAQFLTGTDEHGQKIQRAAEAAGVSPQQFADRVAAEFRAAWDRLGLHYDYFIRTTEPRNTAAVLEVFSRLQAGGYVYKGGYSGPYCVFDELFVGEGNPGDPCPLCGRPTERVSEENYYFKLSAFGGPDGALMQHYRAHPEFIRPESRRNEVMAFVESGLRDVSISRTAIHWGIPVPGDEKHVLYVWFDALIGYLSGIGFGSKAERDQKNWQRLWPGWHLVGKEIVRFHCVYWPAFLMAAGLELPRGIVAHGWLLFDQEKMSKSVGNVVRAEPIRQVLGADALRYFLLREVSFGQDGNFSYAALVARYNSDLANGWGNLASRTLAMIAKYRGGAVPPRHAQAVPPLPAAPARDEFNQCFNDWQFGRALEAVWRLITAADGHISAAKPWALAASAEPDDAARLDDVLRDAYEVLRWTAVLLYPVLPESAEKLWA